MRACRQSSLRDSTLIPIPQKGGYQAKRLPGLTQGSCLIQRGICIDLYHRESAAPPRRLRGCLLFWRELYWFDIMQTALADFIRNTADGQRADTILRKCVHCGFCTATCPTYQLLGDELDGPRGRIYQIKQVLEGAHPTPTLQLHLDRCLTCRACETTCPSGVDYHHLLDIGREQVERLQPRPRLQRLQRKAMVWAFASPARLRPLLGLARTVRSLLPATLRNKIAPRPRRVSQPRQATHRRMLVLDGCVQPAIAPNINQSAARVLAHFGIDLQTVNPGACCGALPHHLSETEKARAMARANIDAWLPHLQADAEAIVITASGCGAQVQDYPYLLADDPTYRDKAQQVADKARDLVEVVQAEDLSQLPLQASAQRTAVHTPCTLQHALQLNGVVDALLKTLGYQLSEVADNHLCCGSAGTYSLTQAEISSQLRTRKLEALAVNAPERIVTANIGCLGQLQDDEGLPVMHWIDLLEQDLMA